MFYKVKARFNEGKSKEFYKKLTDGTIQNQRPDGPEIVESMNRATIDPSGSVKWTETCYCPSPLLHERSTVYDYYFNDMETEVIKTHEKIEGKSFIDHISTS